MVNKKHIQILDDKYPYIIIQGIRQSGKSTLISTKALKTVLLERNKSIGVVTPTVHQLSHLRNMFKNLYEQLPNGFKPRLLKYNEKHFCFSNGSIVHFDVLKRDTFCGLSLNDLLIDEMALIKNMDDALYFMQRGVHQINTNNGNILITSSRLNRSKKKNLFWKLWVNAIDGNQPLISDNINFKTYILSSKDCPHLSKMMLKECKRNMGKILYEKEFTIRNR